MKIPAEGARSKSWDEFAVPGSVKFDFIMTVWDNAAGEICPGWPGHRLTAHWGVGDRAAATGTDAQKLLAFRGAFRALEHRIRNFVNLPLATLDRVSIERELDRIGAELPVAGDAIRAR